MKKIYIIIMMLGLFLVGNLSYSGYVRDSDTEQIYTKDQSNVVKSDDISDPLRDGTTSAIHGEGGSVGGIANTDVSNSDSAQGATLDYISRWINYFLGFLGMIVIILIIKDGIIMITSAGDENKKKEAFKNLRNYILAIIGIGSAYLLVNLIFYFINVNTGVV